MLSPRKTALRRPLARPALIQDNPAVDRLSASTHGSGRVVFDFGGTEHAHSSEAANVGDSAAGVAEDGCGGNAREWAGAKHRACTKRDAAAVCRGRRSQ